MDLISIVVPVYNASKFLDETIRNVKEQTYSDWELVFVDDVSKDDSEKIIKKYMKTDKRIKYFKQDKNGGPALARNRGIEEAKGTFLCFLDADDLWDKDKLEKQINFMKEKNIAFSYTSYEFVTFDGKRTGKKVIAKDVIKYKELLTNTIIFTSTVMFNLNLIDKEKIKMKNIRYVEDNATWFKILNQGYDAYGIKDVFSYYRRSENTESSKKMRIQKQLWKLYREEEKLGVLKTVKTIIVKDIKAIKRRI